MLFRAPPSVETPPDHVKRLGAVARSWARVGIQYNAVPEITGGESLTDPLVVLGTNYDPLDEFHKMLEIELDPN